MRYRINLLPPREQSAVDKVIYFAFHYLRYILVVTQIVVIGVFFSRFSVDQEVIDLKDDLRQKQEIMSVSQPLLDEVTRLEKKIGNVSRLMKQQDDFNGMMAYFLGLFPEKFTLTNLKIVELSIEFTGTTPSSALVKNFYDRVKKERRFSSVILGNIRKEGISYIFNFTLTGYQAAK